MIVRLPIYMPSNGSEGDRFTQIWCERCKHRHVETGTGCDEIYFPAMWDSDHPQEWRELPDGRPICLAFEWEEKKKAETEQ